MSDIYEEDFDSLDEIELLDPDCEFVCKSCNKSNVNEYGEYCDACDFELSGQDL